MSKIQLAIEGQNAVEATKELLEIPEISGDWQPVGGTQRELALATIATIVGIVGGTIAIAEQIRKWYNEWKEGKSGKKIDKVVIIGAGGERLLLEGATAEDISKILEP
jgi:hypothetical protein